MKFKNLYNHFQAGQGIKDMFDSRDFARTQYRRLGEWLQRMFHIPYIYRHGAAMARTRPQMVRLFFLPSSGPDLNPDDQLN